MKPTNHELPFLNIIVPCYNEQEVIHKAAFELLRILEQLIFAKKISTDSRVTFVDDGSKDNTVQIARELHAEQPNRFALIKLSRNKGQQNAILAGLFNSPGDIFITIDADLQDNVNAIKDMVDHYLDGSQIVYGVRNDRSSDNFFKRFTAELYYKFLKVLGVDIVFNHSDFRLLSRKAVEHLKTYTETNLFLRAIIPQLGFKATKVEYARLKRFAGTTKYSFSKLLALAVNGATSFSIVPLRIATLMGLIGVGVTFVLGIWVFWQYFHHDVIRGWSSTMITVFFFGSIQLVFLGIIGEYIGKIYLETKRRPPFIIEEIVQGESDLQCKLVNHSYEGIV